MHGYPLSSLGVTADFRDHFLLGANDMTNDFFASFAARDLLAGIGQYSSTMTISQVVKFFERQGVIFTKTMIQNYVRIGLLPTPAEKRFYHSGHLAMLAMIHTLKDVISLDETRRLFCLADIRAADFNSHLDGRKKAEAAYKALLTAQHEALEKMTTVFLENNANDPLAAIMRFVAAGLLAGMAVQTLLADHS